MRALGPWTIAGVLLAMLAGTIAAVGELLLANPRIEQRIYPRGLEW